MLKLKRFFKQGAIANSRVVVKYFDKEHRNIVRSIDVLKEGLLKSENTTIKCLL